LFVCLHRYPPVTRKRRWRYIDWQNPHPLKNTFPSFPVNSLVFTIEFAVCSKPLSRDNHCKVPYPRTQQRVQRGWEVNLDHAIVIPRSP